MEHSNNIIFYVADPLASASFYKRLLGKDPVMESLIYVQFVISPDLTLAFWQKDDVKPAAQGGAGTCELGLRVMRGEVDARCEEWRKVGAKIVLEPIDLPFGRSFVATDPDGNRLRVYALAESVAA